MSELDVLFQPVVWQSSMDEAETNNVNIVHGESFVLFYGFVLLTHGNHLRECHNPMPDHN